MIVPDSPARAELQQEEMEVDGKAARLTNTTENHICSLF